MSCSRSLKQIIVMLGQEQWVPDSYALSKSPFHSQLCLIVPLPLSLVLYTPGLLM